MDGEHAKRGLELDHHRGGRGEPLVLLHALGMSWRTWKPILPALEKHHDVLAISLPGCGESPALPSPITVESGLDAIEAEMDRHGMKTAHVVGNSVGGLCAVELARRGRAKSVVAISPAGAWTDAELRYASMILRTSHRALRMLGKDYARMLMGNRVSRTVALSVARSRAWRLSPEEADYEVRSFGWSPGVPDMLDGIDRLHPRVENLGEVLAPVLLVWGTWDFVLPYRQAARWTAGLPHVELLTLPRCGHVPICDAPDRLASAIVGWTGRHSPPAAPSSPPSPSHLRLL